MAQVSVSTPFNIFLEFEVAPFYRRVAAWLLDTILLLLFARGMKYFLASILFAQASYSVGLDILLVSMPLLFYHLLMELLFNGQSLGKMATGIRVISIEGGEPRLGQYLMRWIFRLWEWPLFFGYLALDSWGIFFQVFITLLMGVLVAIIIAVSHRSQRLGDLAAGTTVVDLRYRFSLADTLFREIREEDYRVRFPEVMRLSDRDINAIRTVSEMARTRGQEETARRVAAKVQQVLGIRSDMPDTDFLEQLLNDYNYLATRS
jgi:uncharacterized RDD family membrane protein YckC